MPESAEQRHNRELIELLNELRVALPGVQGCSRFLLSVPFANGFPKLSAIDRDVFFAAFVAPALSTVLLIAPSSYHRLRWRQHEISWHRVEPGRALPPSGAFRCVLGLRGTGADQEPPDQAWKAVPQPLALSKTSRVMAQLEHAHRRSFRILALALLPFQGRPR